MNQGLSRRLAVTLGAILALGLSASVSMAQLATFCAEVKLEIIQEATLEREAFDASLKVNNNLTDQPLTDLRVNIFVKDEEGLPADDVFFIKVATLTNTNAIDGSGVVQSSTTAEIRWLIIPSTGAGGILPGGKRYSVKATINGISAGAAQSVTTFDDFITVYPQPSLKLEYVLPYEVFGDEPLTTGLEPIEPFPLGVRVTNVGYGTAKNFQIDSAQPRIVDNKQALPVDFRLLGTVVHGQTIPNTLLVPFGDITAGKVGQASWIMTTTLSGRFISFTSTFTHAAELGGQLTSLIESVTTYTLLRDVVVDLPGRDETPDFLVNASMEREDMQALLDAGGQPPAELLLESDQAAPLTVLEVPADLSGSLSGTNASLTLTFSQGVSSNIWVHASAPLSQTSGMVLQSARAADGRTLNAKNVWISKHFRKSDLTVLHRVNILDLTSAATSYSINFDPATLDAAPGQVLDLAAEAVLVGGALDLSWTAPGEDGYTGDILGGRYLVAHSISSDTVFTPSFAVNFATSTTPGQHEVYALRDIIGNATTYLRLWTQDTGGSISLESNGATTYVLPHPPHDLFVAEIGTDSARAYWKTGNNSLPVEYRVTAATAAGGEEVSSSPFLDSFTSTFTFALAPNTRYEFFGSARNPVSSATSQGVSLASAATLAALPSPVGYADVLFTTMSVVWGANGNPEGTEYLVELATAAPRLPQPLDEGWETLTSGWIASTTHTFTGLYAQTNYRARVKARNLDGLETEFVELDVQRTQNSDVLPPRTTLSTGTPAFGDEPLFVTESTTFSFTAVDDHRELFDGDGVGGTRTYLSVDGGDYLVSEGTFTVAGGSRTLTYYSADFLENVESTRTLSVFVDTTAPVTTPFARGLALESSSLFLNASSTLSFVAADPQDGGNASGVARTIYAFHPALSTQTYEGPLGPFPAGDFMMQYYSEDNVGNQEPPRSFFVNVDTAAPASTLASSGASSQTAAGLFMRGTSSVTIAAADAFAGSITGVARIHLSVDGVESVYESPFTLAEGSHTVVHFAEDRSGNVEAERTAVVYVDDTAPGLALASPLGGETYAADADTIPVRFTMADALDETAVVTAQLVQLEDRGSPRGSRPAVLAVAAGQDLGPFALDDGLWRLETTATDAIGNSTSAYSGSFEVTFPADAQPPRTTVSVGTPTVTNAGTTYVSAKTSLSLIAVDDLNTTGDGLGYGVRSSSVSLDGGPFTSTPTFFALNTDDGPHLLAFYSEDVFGRVESTQTLSLVLDNTPPLLSLTAPADGAALLSSTVTITLTYSDPAAGVNASAVSVFVDGQDRTALASIGPTGASLTVVLADGRHRVWAQTADRLGNVSTDALYFRVDRGPAVLASVRADAASPALGPYGTLTEVLAGADFSSPVGLSTGGLSLLLDGVPQAASMTFQTSASPNWAPNPVITVGLITGGSLAMDRGRLILIGGLYQYSDWRRKCVVIEAADPSNVVPFDNCLPAPRSYAQTFLVDNVLYVAGGQADSDSTREVWYSFLAANGAPQEWRKSAPLLTTFDPGVAHQGIMGAAHVAVPTPSGTRLYILSGESYNNEYWGGLTALIRPDKTLGPWTRAIISSPNMSFDSHIGDNAVYHNGHIYLQGRNLMGMGTLILPLDANGLITNQNNSWAPAIPDTLYRGTLFVAKGRLHHIGGRDYSQPGEPWVTRAYSAQIAADGSVGAWQAETASYAMDGGAAGVMDDVVYAGPAAHFYSSNEFAMVQARSFSDRAVSASLRVPASLAESAHEIAASGSDLRGVAGAGLASYIVDLTTPVSRVETSGSSRTVEGVLRVAAQSALSIAATDPLVAGAAAGIDFTRVSVDGGAEQDGAAFQVAAGAHSLVFYSRDRAGNQEAPQTLSLFAEGDAPAAVADLAATGATANSATLAWTSVGDDGQDGVIEAGETRVHFSTYAAGFSSASAQYAAAIVNEAPGQPREAVVTGLLPGTSYYFKLWTRDTLGNYSDASNTAFAATPGVQDVTPPVTAFAPSTAALALGGTDFYPGSAYFGFVSTDAESGVARVEYRLDGSTEAFAVYAGTFSLAEGARSLEFAGVDVAGNREAESAAAFFVDASAPLTVLEVEGVSGTDAEGRLAVSTSTLLLLTASDLPSPGTAAGTSETVYSLNGPLDAGATVYAGPFALEPGLYTLRFASTDRVGNREADKVQELAVSTRPVNAPPAAVTDLAAATAEDGGALLAGWTAPDDDAEPGLALHGTYQLQHSTEAAAVFEPALAQVVLATASTPGAAESLPLTGLLGNATHHLRLWTRDAEGAVSSESNAASAYARPWPPRDLLLTDVSSISARAAWQAGDNALPIEYRVFAATGAGGVAVSSSPFLVGGEFEFAGLAPATTYTVFGEARNPETSALSPLAALGQFMTGAADDATPPVTVLQVNGVSVATASVVVVSTDALGFAATDVGGGVAQTFYALDGGAETVYASTFSLAAGTHTLAYRSVDLAGNGEALQQAFVAASAAVYAAQSADGLASLASTLADETITPVSTGAVAAAYAVAVDSQGLVLVMPSLYELAPSPVVFDPPATLSLRFDPVGVDTATVSIYRFNGVAWDSAPVTGQQFASIDGGLIEISGTLQTASLYAVFSLPAPAPALVSISVTPSSATLAAGATIQFEATGTFTDLSTRTLTSEAVWTTNLSTVATVDANGLATGLAEGAVQVSASSGAITAFAELTVTAPAAAPPALYGVVDAPDPFTPAREELTLEYRTDAPVAATVEIRDASNQLVRSFAGRVADPGLAAMTQSATFNNMGGNLPVVHGGYAFLSGVDGTLVVEDVRVSSQPVQAAEVSFPSIALEAGDDWAVVGSRLYAVGTFVGPFGNEPIIATIDVADPALPVLVSTSGSPITTSGGPLTNSLVASGNGEALFGAAVNDTEPGILSFLITPSGVVFSTWTVTANSMGSLRVRGSRLYALEDIPTGGNILRVYDASTPSSPLVVLGSVPLNEGAGGNGLTSFDLSADGRYLYAPMDTADGLVVVDISTPSAPAVVREYTSAELGIADVASDGAMLVHGNFLFVGGNTDTNFIDLFDVIVPTAPVHLAREVLTLDQGAGKFAATGNTLLSRGPQTTLLTLRPAGSDRVAWDGRDDSQALVPAGVYGYTVTATGAAGVASATGTVTVAPAYEAPSEQYLAVSGDGVASLSSTRADATVAAISTSAQSAAYGAAVSSQGLVLVTPALYELAPSPVVFSPEALLSFLFDPTAVDTNTIAIYRYEDPLWSTAPITGQTIEILGSTTATISGNLASASLYAVFSLPAPAPVLVSISVTPSSMTITAGATAQFTAEGTFTDASTRALTGEVVWATDLSTVATIDANGLAAGVGGGTALVIASSGSISGQASLTVTAPPSGPAWSQLSPSSDPVHGAPTTLNFNTAAYNPDSKRLIVFGGGGAGGYGVLNDAWVLSGADGTGGTPAWTKLAPAAPNGAPVPREAHAAVYDRANNRMIVHGGYTTPGNCGGVVSDAWVLTNADGTGGAPEWVPLSPAGTAPARRYHGAAYDAANNRLIINGGAPSGCGAGGNDTYVLTNANGLGGAPEWTQLAPTAPANFPSDSSGGSTAYDPASNRLLRFHQLEGASIAVWALSNGNGLGGVPAWSEIDGGTRPAVLDWVGPGGVYDPGTNKFVFFGAGASASSETWVLSNANGVGVSQWTRLLPAGQPDARVRASLVYAPDTDRATMFGGTKDGWNGTGEVWTLANALGAPAAPAELTAISVTPSTASIPAGETLQFTAAGEFSSGLTRTLIASDGVQWSVDYATIAWIDASGLATGAGAGAARVSAASGAVAGYADLTVGATSFLAVSSDGLGAIASSLADMTITPVSTGAVAAAYAVAVDSQGLVLMMPSLYELAPSPVVFDPPATLSLRFDPVGVDTATVSIYRFDGVAWGSAPVTGQQLASIDGGLLEISGTLQTASLYAAFSVTAPAPALASITVTPASATLAAGATAQFEATGTFTDLSTRAMTGEVVWTTDASSVATVDAGLATGVASGATRVIASSGAVAGHADLAVTAPFLAGLKGYWKMDEAGGPTLIDELGSANAVLTGGRTTGVRGGGIAPDAVGSIAVDPVDLNTPAWTIMGWFRIDAARGDTGATLWGNLYDGYTFYDPLGWTICHVSQNSAMLDTNQGGFYVTSPAAAGLTVDDGAWHHAAQVYGGGVLKLYVDGVYLGGENRPATLGGTSRLNFGNGGPRQGGYGKFVGDLDEFAVLDRALSQTELLAVKAQVTLSTAASAPTLAAITVTPATASIAAGATIQFEAAGTFTDGSTRTLTGEALWSADVSSVATVNAGLATGVGGGTAQVIASSGAISGQAALTVTFPALTVASISPSSAEAGTSVSAAVAGTGFDASAALSLERLAVAQGTWTATGSFGQGRLFSTLTRLPDGRALLAGGMIESQSLGLPDADVYDPETGTWTAAAPMIVGRFQHAAVPLADGRVLVTGGQGPAGTVVGTAEIYDPATGAWTAAAPMANVRKGHRTERLPDGRVLAVGGYNGSSMLSGAELYDPAANSWSAAASMSVARLFPGTAVLADGKILVAGGRDLSSNHASAAIYDPATNAWTATGSMAVARQEHMTTTLPGGKVLVSGGGSDAGITATAETYDPASGTWTPTAPMAYARLTHAMVAAGGTALVIGGQNASTDWAVTEVYDAATNAWRPGPSLTGTRTLASALILDDGKVLVAAGRRGLAGGTSLNSAELLSAPAEQVLATGVTVADQEHLSGTVDLTGAATGYWDIVVRQSGGRVGRLDGGFQVTPVAPTLAAITVTPATASIEAGATIQFEAAGTFTDGSTRTLTGEALWSADVSSVATVNAGLATGVGGGTAQVIASSGAIAGYATLTVTVPPLTVASIAPSSAAAGTSVAAALAGTGFDASAALTLERADALSGTWAATGSFAQGRFESSLTKLRDGRMLLAGGQLAGSAVGWAYADLYDPATGAWTAGPPLNQGRYAHDAVMLDDGRVLVTGGLANGTIASAEIYDPALNVWTPAASMSAPRHGPHLALLPDGRVLAAGGSNGANVLSSAEIYDPASNSWSPASSMNEQRNYAAIATLNNGKVLVAGGWVSATAEVYDPGTNAWSAAGTMSVGRQGMGTAVFADGKILVTGGRGAAGTSGAADVYDPATNAWTTAAALGVARYGHAMLPVGGTALVIGGETPTTLASTEIYDQATNAWRPGPSLTATRSWLKAVVLDDGRVLAAGGLRNGSTNLNTAELLGAAAVSIAATGVTVTDAQHLTGNLDLTGAATGYWDVVVRRTGGQAARLDGGFEVLPGAPADTTPPVVSLSFSTPSFTASGGGVTIGTQALISLFGLDPSSTAPASGVAQILYAVDETTPNVTYTAPFTLAAGAHAIYFSATDVAGNSSTVSSAALSAAESPFVGAFAPASGSIGIAYSMAGFGFGAFGGANTLVRFGLSTTPVSVWNDASIVGTVPGLSTGAHAVTLERWAGSTVTITAAGTYTVTPLVPALSVASGPIGLPFTLSGPGFGTFSGTNSRVLFAGATAPVSAWNDATISGTIPGIAAGTTTVIVERQTADGFVSQSEPLPFTVTVPSVTAVSPSSAPIGGGFALAGWSFGNFAGTNTRVLIGGATTPVAVWNDTTIIGTVPGALAPGEHELVVERRTADGFTARSASVPFTVAGLGLAAVSPSTGAIGIPFTLTGAGFGAYLGANSRVKFGVSTAAVSVWTDGSISGTVPTLATGAYAVTVERQQGEDVSVSNASTFTVIAPDIASVTPSSGPIGTVFTLSGTGFGPFAGANTFLLLGGTTTPITVWNDTTITATVPGSLTQGVQELVAVRRNADGGLSSSNTAYFTVTALSIASVSPSTGAIGIPFTISGSEFGVFLGADSRVRFGVSTAAVSVWNDTTISGTVPTLATGAYAVTVERQQGEDVSVSNAFTFTVVAPEIASVTPSSGPIGTVFTVSGEGFGPFAGINTFLLLDGATTPISVWNDATITATVPGSLTTGIKELTAVRRNADGGLSVSNTAYFEVTGMSIASINPSTGPIGIPFTIKGSQFGVFLGANSRVRFGVSTAAVTVWNDTTISGTLPALSTGAHAVVIERQQGTEVTFSEPSSFTVTELAVGTLTPSSGPIGAAFTITGEHFGPFAGTNTRLLLGGTTVAVTVWNDTTITGTVPNLAAGSLPLWLERKSGTGVQSSATTYFLVTTPLVASMVPSSAPIGAPFTLNGTSFGTYGGANTRVKFNGVVAAVSVWNDVKIVGTVPGAVSTGPAVLVVERAAGAGVSSSAEQAFEVLRPVISTVTPGYGPAGTVVTLSGHGFGPYGGTATRLLVGGSTVTVSVWNDTTIRWTVTAAFTNGDYPLVVRREPAGGVIESEPASFTVGTGYGGASFGFAAPLSLAAQPDVNFEGGLNLPVDEGGRVETASKAAVDVPANALGEDTEITLKRLRPDGLRTEAAGEDKKRAAGEAIEFGPAGTVFNTPVTIELPYDPALAGDETLLAVHYYDPLRRAWEELPSVVDRARHVVRAQTAHFSIYQPMGGLAPLDAAQDAFYFRDQYAFPNPSRGGAVTFRIQPGLADTIELRVYDLSGRRIHSSTDFVFRGPIDDGNGKGDQNTYDHVWNVGGVGSGVYRYVIKASRAGQSPIVKSGKVGVIK